MTFEQEIQNLPEACRQLLATPDGGWKLCELLPKIYRPEDVAHPRQRSWEVCGLALLNLGRFHEAYAIFETLYQQMLRYEIESSQHTAKGVPLVWMSECQRALGRTMTARRLIMLTLIEDAVACGGIVSPTEHGSYFRAVWIFGIAHAAIVVYARRAYELYLTDTRSGVFPEWILQQLDTNWVAGYPASAEVDLYPVNRRYVRHLLSHLGDGSGLYLDFLAEYLMGVMPGCRVYRRMRTRSSDHDLVCAMEGVAMDFRAEFGRYFVCECKDWETPAGYTEFARLCRVLDSVKAKFGILFSKQGISGSKSGRDAAREQLKVYQDRGIVIAVISEHDLKAVADGQSFIAILRSQYERVRLDLQPERRVSGASRQAPRSKGTSKGRQR